MPNSELVNPGGNLLPEIAARLFRARKIKSLWAKPVNRIMKVKSLEGWQTVQPGEYLCRGIHGEIWPQKAQKLLGSYLPTHVTDDEGWQRFDPKPDGPWVEAAVVSIPFRILSLWGELTGKPGDYLVRSSSDTSDIWIVDRAIFEASYEPIPME